VPASDPLQAAGDAGEAAALAAWLAARAEAARPGEAAPVVHGRPSDARLVLHRAAHVRVQAAIALAHGAGDRVLVQEVSALDDIVAASNGLVERLREWVALHAPQAARVPDARPLAAAVAADADRAALVTALGLADAGVGEGLRGDDQAALVSFATALRALHASWDTIESRVRVAMEDVAPTLAAIVGPVLGARLIAAAGTLERLATWPAGTVQTLGAETALFRHKKEGTLPPKHGILFQHPAVYQAPLWQRGRAARALANHAAIAARCDAYGDTDRRALLLESLDADLKRVAARPRPRPHGRPGGARGPRGPWSGPGSGPRSGSRSAPRGGTRGGPTGAPRGPRRDDRGPKPDRAPPGRGPKPGRKATPDRGPPRPRGAGAFRRPGDGPAKPPGGRRRADRDGGEA
jgi:nucleolar protein 56